MNAMTNLPLHDRRPVSIRPVSARGWRKMTGDRRCTHAGAEANYAYITRSTATDARGTIDYRQRNDLIAAGLELPSSHPRWAEEPGRVWRELDDVARDLPTDASLAWHLVVTLPPALDAEDWIDMVRSYASRSIARHGPAVAWAIHAKPDGLNDWAVHPHAHLLVTTSGWRHDSNHGRTVPNWCGPTMRARMHADWLARLPHQMRAAANSPYLAGGYVPANPDCSALRGLFAARRAE